MKAARSRKGVTLELRTDRAYLATTAYADDGPLTDRMALYEHQRPRIDLEAEVLARLGEVAGRRVADIGCGNGRYVGPLASRGAAVVALDLSAGMLRSVTALARVGRAVADAQALPVRARSLDAALAMHMLYHVPDPALALREAARTLRPGGRFVAAVGGPRHLAEAGELWRRLLEGTGVQDEVADIDLINRRVPKDALARLLGEHFAEVECSLLASTVVLQGPGPLVRHMLSSTAARAAAARGLDISNRLRGALEEAIGKDGAFWLTTEVALFSARAGGN